MSAIQSTAGSPDYTYRPYEEAGLDVYNIIVNRLPLPPNLGQFPNLQGLSVEWIQDINADAFAHLHLPNLRCLTLSASRTPTLPSGLFRNQRQLHTLSIAGSLLKTLPPGLFQGLTQLQSLYLESNKEMTALDPALFRGLPQLKHLRLWGNGLTTLPQGI